NFDKLHFCLTPKLSTKSLILWAVFYLCEYFLRGPVNSRS
ncbi:hypothetical protein HMPREF0793_1093, partial [Staphylococcus caprae M23864:W1]